MITNAFTFSFAKISLYSRSHWNLNAFHSCLSLAASLSCTVPLWKNTVGTTLLLLHFFFLFLTACCQHSTVIQNSKHQHAPKRSITFIRFGEQAQHQFNSSGGLLSTAQKWQLQVDLEHHNHFILPRCSAYIGVNETSGPTGTDCPLERLNWRSQWV